MRGSGSGPSKPIIYGLISVWSCEVFQRRAFEKTPSLTISEIYSPGILPQKVVILSPWHPKSFYPMGRKLRELRSKVGNRKITAENLVKSRFSKVVVSECVWRTQCCAAGESRTHTNSSRSESAECTNKNERRARIIWTFSWHRFRSDPACSGCRCIYTSSRHSTLQLSIEVNNRCCRPISMCN
jgi:hypothetical protein